ncbi:hypothetical protein [Limosilactobacillus reuteri]|nr:hypothetical protein [Limosilactobacillus reuteri]
MIILATSGHNGGTAKLESQRGGKNETNREAKELPVLSWHEAHTR